jgi:hypothetical protein
MKNSFFGRSLASLTVILATLGMTSIANAQTIVADWTLDGTDFNSPSAAAMNGLPPGNAAYQTRASLGISDDNNLVAVDTVGGHNMTGYFNDGNLGTFGSASIGGPSTKPTYFSASGLGWYGAEVSGSTTLPTNDFTLSLYEQTTSTTQTGVLFTSDNGSTGSFQIGITGGNFVAYLNNGTGNLSGTLLGEFAVNSGDNHLSLTDIGGVFTFTDNGVNALSVTNATSVNFNNAYIGIPPGGAPSFTGYMSDVTITANVDSLPVPEPSTYLMIGLGFLGLVAVRRFRRLNA